MSKHGYCTGKKSPVVHDFPAQGRFSGFKSALKHFNPSFKVRNIDNTVDVCRIRLDITPPAQGLDTQPVHARATARTANGLRWHSS